MLLRAELPCREGILSLRLGTKISLHYIEKRTGARKPVHITPSPLDNHYFALFDEDDVDFEIVTDNRTSIDRDFGFDLKVYGNTFDFVQEKNSRGLLKALQTNGRKFHFVKQSGHDGQALVSAAAFEHGISYERASIMVSQLKFTVHYSLPKISLGEIPIHVRTLSNRVLTIGVTGGDTIESIKMRIEVKEGAPVDQQRLIFRGKQMEDCKTVKEYGILSHDVIHLVLRLSGGGWNNHNHNNHSNKLIRGDVGGICAEHCENHDTMRQHLEPQSKVFGSEKGVICFGDKSQQSLNQARFVPDRSIRVEPFVVEMRMASRYKLLEFISPGPGPRITFSKPTDSQL